jgi:integrase
MNLKESDLVWEWLEKQQTKGKKENQLKAISERKKERGSGLAFGAIEKYKYLFHTLMELVEKKTGKNDPIKVKPNDVYSVIDNLILEYQNGKTGISSFLRGIDDALHIFKEASKVSGVYKRELRLGDKRVIAKKLNDKKVYRKAKDTTVMQATREDMEKVIVEIEKSKSNRKAKDMAIAVLRLEFTTGKRIRGLLRSKVGNYDPNTDQYINYGDKGGKNNEVYFLTSEAKMILDKLVLKPNGLRKSDGDMLFKIQFTQHKDSNKNGQDKPVDAMYNQISTIVKNAAKKAGVNLVEEGRKFSSHSCRKGFGVERANFYLSTMNAFERKKELERRVQLDPRLGERVNKVLENIKSKFKIKKNAQKRDFTDVEIVKLLVSTDINHSRIDVMRYYLLDYNFSSVLGRYK